MITMKLPPFCGPMSDMGRTQACGRVGFVYSLHSRADEIERARARLPRCRSERRRANLAAWIADAEADQVRFAEAVEGKVCTHAEPVEIANMEDALPACTC